MQSTTGVWCGLLSCLNIGFRNAGCRSSAVLLVKGQGRMRLGAARRKGLLAIELRPDYWPAYAVSADHYQDMNESSPSRRWLQRRLQAAPDSKALKRRLDQLATRPPRKSAER